MKIQQIRNAMVKITYGNKTFLTDPWLTAKGTSFSFADVKELFQVPDERMLASKMPLCDLPMSVDEVMENVDACILTHVHPDHIDMNIDFRIADILDRNILIYVQSDKDAMILKDNGFTNVIPLNDKGVKFGDVTLVKTPGLHGTKLACGDSCGVIFQSSDEKTLYLAGDTVWYDGVENTINKYNPEVIILNACAAVLNGFGRLIMDDEDVAKVYKAAPKASIIASHMDNVAHATLTRETLKNKLYIAGIADKILIPSDGEIIVR